MFFNVLREQKSIRVRCPTGQELPLKVHSTNVTSFSGGTWDNACNSAVPSGKVAMGLSQQFAIQRKHPRYNCTCGVEVRASDAKSGYWATLADICLGGCYLTTFSPLPAGTQVVLRFDAPGGAIVLNGETVTFHPGVGMGIQFTDSSSEEQAHLKTWLESLTAAT